MEIFIIVVLLIVATLLFLAELFLIPGTSLAGFLAGGCCIYAVYYAYISLGTAAWIITMLAALVLAIGSLILFMRSKTLDKVALKQNIDSKLSNEATEKVKVGDTGTSTTRLALIGYADIHGEIVEVKSENSFIDPQKPIVVTRITDGIILVQEQQD